jgi:hypothetical protein
LLDILWTRILSMRFTFEVFLFSPLPGD